MFEKTHTFFQIIFLRYSSVGDIYIYRWSLLISAADIFLMLLLAQSQRSDHRQRDDGNCEET